MTLAHQVPLSMEFSRQEYWSGLPFPPPGDLLDSGIEPTLAVAPVLAGGLFLSHLGSPLITDKTCYIQPLANHLTF